MTMEGMTWSCHMGRLHWRSLRPSQTHLRSITHSSTTISYENGRRHKVGKFVLHRKWQRRKTLALRPFASPGNPKVIDNSVSCLPKHQFSSLGGAWL